MTPRSLWVCVLALQLTSAAGAAVITTANCSLSGSGINFTYQASSTDAQQCQALPEPGFRFETFARAMVAGTDTDASLQITAAGNTDLVRSYAAHADASYNSSFTVATGGTLRPGFVRLTAFFSSVHVDGVPSASIQFGNYSYGMTSLIGQTAYVPALLPVMLGTAIPVNLSAKLSGSSDAWRTSVVYGESLQLRLTYQLFESDRISIAAFETLSSPEPGTFAVGALLFMSTVVIAARRRRRAT